MIEERDLWLVAWSIPIRASEDICADQLLID